MTNTLSRSALSVYSAQPHAFTDWLIHHQWVHLLEIQEIQMEMIEDVIGRRARSTSVESGATPNVLSDSRLLHPPGLRGD